MIVVPAYLECDAHNCTCRVDIELEIRNRSMYAQMGSFEIDSVPGSIDIFVFDTPAGWTEDYKSYYCPEHKEPWTR